MTRSSRHKSSKHREARDYSDEDLSSKDRKESGGGGGGRVLKESSEKRKVEVKESEYAEELVTSSSKRRKEKERVIVVDVDGGSDRWNSGGGGEYDRKGETTTKNSSVKDAKSRKRDGSVEMYGEEVKKSSGKSEGKHREKERVSSRSGVEREKKSKDGRSSGGEVVKQCNENIDLNGRKDLESPEPEIQIDRRLRKRRGDSGDTDKHLDFVEDINGVRLSSKDDLGRVDRQKEDRFGEKFREDMDRDNKPRDEKQRDEKQRSERSTKYNLSTKSEDKHLRDEKDLSDTPQKRSKLQDGELKGEHDRDRNRDRDSYHARDREWYHDREHGWDHGRDREHGWDHGRDRDYGWDLDWDREKDGDRDRERNHDRERGRDRDRDGERDRDYDWDYDGSHLDDRSTRYKDSTRGKRRSPDDRDDSTDAKPRGVKPRYYDFEKKPSSGDRVESDVNKGRSQSRQAYADSNKRRTSPSSNSNAGIDEYRYGNPEDTKYRESIADQRSKALPPRDVSGGSERGSKYRSMDKPSKMDDYHLGELSNEKPSGSKASPMALMERSPSSSSIDRRFMNKNSARRSIDIEETGRRSSGFDNRDFSNAEDRPIRDLALEKPFMDDSFPADSLTHDKSGQSNFSSFPHPNFKVGAESPSFSGSVEEDGRINSSARYRRSSDPNLVRGPWRGVPNWPSPVPNGFMPFPHGGPHGGFQGMLPQFSAPPIFGVRPSMEINHFGIPYQIADDRFPGHLRPLGSQNMMEGLGPSHMHPWDGSTGAFRDDSNNYGVEWDQNRHPMTARGWDPTAEPWKAQNNDAKRDIPYPSPRNDYPLQSMVDDGVVGQVGQMSHHEDNQDLGVHTKKDEMGSAIASPIKESPVVHEKSQDGSNSAIDEVPSFCHYYLSKLDISAELAHTELYNQCMSILDTEESSAVDEDPTIHTILKAAKAGSRSSKSLFGTSLFPPAKDCVFQKAMDLYKRERIEAKVMPYVAGGRLDIILASIPKTIEATLCVVEKVDQLVLKTEAEMEDVPVSSSDEKNALVTISSGSVEERPNELFSTPVQEIQNHTSHGSPELEMAVEDSGLVESEEPQTVPNGVEMDSLSSEQVTLEVVVTADGVSLLESKSSLPTTTTLPAVGNNVSKVEEDESNHPAEEGVAVDAIKGPSVIPDGSPKACNALMSGSNESDSVILSRVHHSPESTH